MKVAFLGLGVLGYPMAGHLSKSGYDVNVYNRTKQKSELWIKDYKGNAFNTPSEAVKGCNIVFACVGNDNDIKEVCVEPNGAFECMEKESIFVDHTTASANVARELSKIGKEKYSISFLDAPVSGGQAGPVGSGQLTKMVNQICIAGLLQGLSEGIRFGMLSGLDIKKVVDVISKGAAGSWQMQNRAETMAKDKFDFGFAIELMHKDLQICIEESNKNRANLPITKLIDDFYVKLIDQGYNRFDTSSLIKLL